jgi:hypothetical protein
VTGKIWVGGKHQKSQTSANGTVTGAAALNGTVPATVSGAITEYDSEAWEIGGKAGAAGFELVGYYYNGKNADSGIGTAINTNLLTTANALNAQRDNKGGYVQATYVLPFKTKIGASWGQSTIERNGANAADLRDAEREAWVLGAYHPLTKHLNLVAEYNHLDVTSMANAAATAEGKAKTMSLGAILFF